MPTSRPSLLAFVLPALALQLLAVATLASGRDTLYLRDVLTTHLPMRQAEAAALRHGALPLLDLQRAGGQPSLGNPNGAPLYPLGLLLALVSPPLWALNAHFWIHLLLAPWSFFWLARRLGCGREAAWAGGVAYAFSGFFLSQMSYYDLVAGVALAPALVAACLAAKGGGRAAAAVAGALWAALLLAGDPSIAALALAAAGLAVALVAPRPRPGALLALALALALGTLVAAPQLVELLRALPTSTRGVRGYDEAARTLGSWDPRQVLDQLIPFAFGRVDRVGPGGFWGQRFHTGALPFFLTLYPGVLPLALAAAAGRARGRGGGFAWAALAAGLLLALGRFDPLLVPLKGLPGGGWLRFPVKAWLLVGIGLASLAAAGWERALVVRETGAGRRLRAALAGLAGLLLLGGAVAALAPASLAAWMARQLPPLAPRTLLDGEPRRWAWLALATAALAAALAALAARVLRLGSDPVRGTRAGVAAAVALALHAGVQLALLAAGTMARDRAQPFERSPAFAAALPARTRIAHGSLGRLFGLPERALPADGSGRWLARQGAAAGYPLAGVPLGWCYELAVSPEGLDGFLTRLAADAVRALDDAARVRLLRAWSVDALVLERPLRGEVPGATPLAAATGPLAAVRVYRLEGTAPAARRVGGVRFAREPRQALAALVDPTFDASREVVLAGDGPARPAGAGRVRVERDEAESIVVDSSDTRPGWVVIARDWQPQWGAAVDGRSSAVLPADLHRMAVAVGAGRHRLRLTVERSPLHRALVAAGVGVLGLAVLAAGGRRRRLLA